VICLLGLLGSSSSAQGAAKILPLGDSITRGSNDALGDIPGGYRRKLGELLVTAGVDHDFVGGRNDNTSPGMDPDHDGNNGFRTDQMIANLPALLALQPDTVLLMAGTNDILQGVPVATAADQLRSLIETLTLSDPHRRVCVSTIIPITQAWGGRSEAFLNTAADAYNVQVRELVRQQAEAGRRVLLVDMNALLVYSDPNPDRNFFQPGDGLHPGQAGYDQMAEIWHSEVTANGPIAVPPVAGTPAAPAALTATVVSGSRINLAWADHSDNETGFKVYRKTGTFGPWEVIAVRPAGATSHAATGLATGVNSYQFAVSSTNSASDSAWSNLVSTTFSNLALYQPASASSAFSTTFAAVKANDGDINSLWSTGGGDTSARWTVDLATPWQIQQVQVVTRQDIDQPNTRRNFEIRGSNDPAFASYSVLAGQGSTALAHASTLTASVSIPNGFRYLRLAKTDTSNFTLAEVRVFGAVPTTLPAAPSNLIAGAVGSNRIELSWSVNSSNESGFKLERSTGGGGFVEIAVLPAATVSLTDHPLAAEITCSYRLRAFNEVGDSVFSNVATASTGPVTAYDSWAAGYPAFSALPPPYQDPAADPNGDGINNLLCYGLGLDPLSNSASASTPRLASASETLTFTYRRNKLAPELTHEVLVSPDLSDGSWSVLSQQQAVTSELIGNQNVEEISMPIPTDPENSHHFVRLRVTR